ncbi:MAG: exodeoxyribonuclease VII large subunit [Candidatus Moraniibacteriota bacterium]
MSDILTQKLRAWRRDVASTAGVELFRVLPNKVLEDIARLKPTCKEDLLAVKGIREKKFEKYGRDILAIIQECSGGGEVEIQETYQEKNKIYTVSNYLDSLNSKLSQAGAAIKGEVSSISIRNGHAYFAIKDKSDESLLNCFMWARNYEMSGIDLVEGMEVIIHGIPEVYKPYGKLSFKTSVIELVGEGALKKAYEALKKKLEVEGLFAEERKKLIPDFPHKVGLITSRDGAVIGDFNTNIGNFGYEIIFMDSRVEGAAAISDLINAVDYFEDKDIDVLVIIRGGGSLESLQAFNNEMLIRKVADLKMPVICGIGHDKDMPLLSYVADKAVSTPTAVAQVLNKSWERALDRLDSYEKSIINQYETIVRDSRDKIENASNTIKEFYQETFRNFERYEQVIKNNLITVDYSIKREKKMLERTGEILRYHFGNNVGETKRMLDNFGNELYSQHLLKNIGHSLKLNIGKLGEFGENFTKKFIVSLNGIIKKLDDFEKDLNSNNPERQLKLGYSIIRVNGKIVKSISQVNKGDELISKLSDGEVYSKAEKIVNQ